MKKIMVGGIAALLSLGAAAQEEAAAPAADAPVDAADSSVAEAAAPAPHARAVLDDRFYLSPSVSYVFADSGRQTDDGYAASLSVGGAVSKELVLEAFAQYTKLDHESGDGTADIRGYGLNGLFFFNKNAATYLLVGAGYGEVKSQPGGVSDYDAVLLNFGLGHWWKPFSIGFLRDLSIRTDATWRLDAHNEKRTGVTSGNGRKDFGDFVLGVGLTIPVGAAKVKELPLEPEPVQVVPVEQPVDADADGVEDTLDQCPGSAAGASVDASGCAADAAAADAPPPAAESPEAPVPSDEPPAAAAEPEPVPAAEPAAAAPAPEPEPPVAPVAEEAVPAEPPAPEVVPPAELSAPEPVEPEPMTEAPAPAPTAPPPAAAPPSAPMQMVPESEVFGPGG